MSDIIDRISEKIREVDIQRLTVHPGEILIVRIPHEVYDKHSIREARAVLSQLLPGIPFLVCDDLISFETIHPIAPGASGEE